MAKRLRYNVDLDEVQTEDPGPSSGAGDELSERKPDEGVKVVSVEEAVESLGCGLFQLKIYLICGLFTLSDAMEMLLLSVLSPLLRCEWRLGEWQVAFITTVVFIGMFSLSSVWGSWADKFGRKPVMLLAACLICYFGMLTAFSPNYYWILICRGLVGMSFGGAVQSFTLLSEYLPHKTRAKLLIIYNVMWATGSCFEILMAYLIIPTLGWRYLVGISALPILITIIFIWSLPESVRYLVTAGRAKEARVVLEKAAALNKATLPPGELQATTVEKRGRIQDLFNRDYRCTTALLWVIWLGTAFTYYGVILVSSEILEFTHLCDPEKPGAGLDGCSCKTHGPKDYVMMIIATFGEFVSIPINLLTIDWLGRKWTILLNFLACALFFLLIISATNCTMLTVYTFGVRAFSAGTFNAVYIYTSEVYPTTMRSIGLGCGSAMARIGAMVTPFISQVLLQASIKAGLSVYGTICIICAICAFCLPLETKDRAMPSHHDTLQEEEEGKETNTAESRY